MRFISAASRSSRRAAASCVSIASCSVSTEQERAYCAANRGALAPTPTVDHLERALCTHQQDRTHYAAIADLRMTCRTTGYSRAQRRWYTTRAGDDGGRAARRRARGRGTRPARPAVLGSTTDTARRRAGAATTTRLDRGRPSRRDAVLPRRSGLSPAGRRPRRPHPGRGRRRSCAHGAQRAGGLSVGIMTNARASGHHRALNAANPCTFRPGGRRTHIRWQGYRATTHAARYRRSGLPPCLVTAGRVPPPMGPYGAPTRAARSGRGGCATCEGT